LSASLALGKPIHRSQEDEMLMRKVGSRGRRFVRRHTEPLEARRLFSIFTVSNINDSGVGSLRQAISDANAAAGADTINFAIGTGLTTIAPTAPLPTITDPLVIDGSTQPGYSGAPLIEINGASSGSIAGLRVTAGASTLRGLILNRFRFDAIELSDGGGNAVQDCWIGISNTGTAASANAGVGIYVNNSSGNTIGGNAFTSAAGTFSARNVISGNSSDGVFLEQAGAHDNLISNNYIGLNVAGTSGVGNRGNGVVIGAGAHNNTIGGTSPADRNVISGNSFDGIEITGVGAAGNVVQGNYVGTLANGATARANGTNGIKVEGANFGTVTNNLIGGTVAGARNIISGNTGDGIQISGGATGTVVQGNYVGIDASGTATLSNFGDGINIISAPGNIVGGTTPAARNVISSNEKNGVEIQDTGAVNNIIQGNYIGLNAAGTSDLRNRDDGVDINSTSFNTVGGSDAGAGNVISGNASDGVEIAVDSNRFTGDATQNLVQGNLIGTNASGTAAIGNHANGVRIVDNTQTGTRAFANTIGGTSAAVRNVISGNQASGVNIQGIGAINNLIQGNYIGTDATGAAGLGNGTAGTPTMPASGAGVTILAANNMVGGTTSGAGNIISANLTHGVTIVGTGNVVQGNLIGTTASGAAGIGNLESGIKLGDATTGAATNSLIGGAAGGAGNVIALNGKEGISVVVGSGNAIRRNSLFSNGRLGIDLGSDGVTPNDAGDADGGANQLQNFAILSQSGNMLVVSVSSAPSSTFTVELFTSAAADPSGFGEGGTFVSDVVVNTDTSGNGSASIALPPVAPGQSIFTATVTDAVGNTSEFSPVLSVAPPPTTVSAAAFEYNAPVQSIRLEFSGDVGATFGPEDLQLTNLTTNSAVPVSSIAASYDPATHTGTYTFPGFANGLPSGNYAATLLAAGVIDSSGQPIDGDSNGSPGGDYSLSFFFLFADANHDRNVDTLDFNALAANFGGSGKLFSEGDFNYDGRVDTLDFNALAANFGRSLPTSTTLVLGKRWYSATLRDGAHGIQTALPGGSQPVNAFLKNTPARCVGVS
jgi:titin